MNSKYFYKHSENIVNILCSKVMVVFYLTELSLCEYYDDLYEVKTLANFGSFLPPLVIRVDVPDAALDEDLVFVHGEQGAQRERGQLLNHDGVAGAVTLEDLLENRIVGLGESCQAIKI